VPARRPVLLYVVNVAWYFCLHRLHLAQAARDAGFEVHVAASPDTPAHARQIAESGFIFHPLRLRRGTWSVLGELRLSGTLLRLYRSVRPDLVHHVTIKPVLCGTLAARVAKVPAIVNSVPGLGFVFTATDRWAGLRRRAVQLAYRVLFAARSVRVIFENQDDLGLFVGEGIVSASRAALIRGVGVDLERFRPGAARTGVPLVVLVARMLWDKGVREFCAAAARLKAAGVGARLVLVGGLDPGNPAAVPEGWLNEQQRAGSVEWWGQRDDIPAIYAMAHIVCLPSYREGLPTVLLEAAACGCALVASDVPGCREVVRDGETGVLVRARDEAALAQGLRALIEDAALRTRLADSARALVVGEFSAGQVAAATNRLYRELLAERLKPAKRGGYIRD
jgi:glycosyltransferase involved in cell wall biosynthesis